MSDIVKLNEQQYFVKSGSKEFICERGELLNKTRSFIRPQELLMAIDHTESGDDNRMNFGINGTFLFSSKVKGGHRS